MGQSSRYGQTGEPTLWEPVMNWTCFPTLIKQKWRDSSQIKNVFGFLIHPMHHIWGGCWNGSSGSLGKSWIPCSSNWNLQGLHMRSFPLWWRKWRLLGPVSTDPEEPFILTPATVLTHKTGSLPTHPEGLDNKDLHKRQWKLVQTLANTFWDRWRKQYLFTLQPRPKWQSEKQNITEGSMVLMKGYQTKRNEWPLGRVNKTFASTDGKVRKVEIKTTGKDGTKLFLRPISEIVLLLPADKIEEWNSLNVEKWSCGMLRYQTGSVMFVGSSVL